MVYLESDSVSVLSNPPPTSSSSISSTIIQSQSTANSNEAGESAAVSTVFSRPQFPSTTSRRPPIDRASSARLHYIGRPGSRRYQRYLNKSFLLENHNYITTEDLKIYTNTYQNPLSTLNSSVDNRIKFDPFISTTEEKQKKLLKSMMISTELPVKHSRGSMRMEISSTTAYSLIDTKIRKLMKKMNLLNDDFFCNMDKILSDFVLASASTSTSSDFSLDNSNNNNNSNSSSDSEDTLVFNFDDASQRMICHGICQYYRLHSLSKIIDNSNDNNKDVVIRRTETTSLPSSKTLSQHVQHMYANQKQKKNYNSEDL